MHRILCTDLNNRDQRQEMHMLCTPQPRITTESFSYPPNTLITRMLNEKGGPRPATQHPPPFTIPIYILL